MPRVSVQVVVDGIAETMAVRQDQTAEDLLRSVVAVRGLDAAPASLCLRHSFSGMWLPESEKLAHIKEGDFLDVKRKEETGQCTVALGGLSGKLAEKSLGGTVPSSIYSKSAKSTTVSYDDPLRSMVPLFTRILGLKGKEELAFKAVVDKDSSTVEVSTEFLNTNFSLRELKIESNAKLLLVPVQLLQEKVTLGSIEHPQREDWLVKSSKKGDSKSTSEKKRWCVLDKHFLYYFSDKKSGSKPNGVIDLEHMIVERNNPECTSITMSKSTVSFMHQPICFVLSMDSESGSQDLEKCLSAYNKHSVNGARTTLFGVALCDLVKEHEMPPAKLSDMVKYLLTDECIKSEGIFRVSGIASIIEGMKRKIDAGLDVNFSGYKDPHSVSGLLKLYLRELPQPLLCYHNYEALVSASEDSEKIHSIVATLPQQHQIVLDLLLELMGAVVENTAYNKMDPQAIATVMTPNILRIQPKEETSDTIMRDSSRCVKVVMKLLEEHQKKNQIEIPAEVQSNSNAQEQTIEIQSKRRTLRLSMGKIPVEGKQNPTLRAVQKGADWRRSLTGIFVQAMYDYKSQGLVNSKEEIDLSFSKGNTMMLIEERTSGWMKVNSNGVQGLVPANYFMRVEQSSELGVPMPDTTYEEVKPLLRAPSKSMLPAPVASLESPSRASQEVQPIASIVEPMSTDPAVLQQQIESLSLQLESERNAHQAEMQEIKQRLMDYEVKYGLM